VPMSNRTLTSRKNSNTRKSKSTDARAQRAFATSALVQRAHANPASLESDELIHLQSVMGNRALSQLMSSGSAQGQPAVQRRTKPLPQISAGRLHPPTVDRMIQRLIGFEIETRIPVWKEVDDDTVEQYSYNEINADIGTGDGSKVSTDKTDKNSIIEFVSGPVSDTQSVKDFTRTARRWVNVLAILRNDAVTSPPVDKLKNVVDTAPDESYFGFLKSTDDKTKADILAVQATHGLRLDQVQNYFNKMRMPGQIKTSHYKKEQAIIETNPVMDTFMDAMTTRLNPKTIIKNSSKRKTALAETRGFFSLMAQYMIAGNKNIPVDYLKNQTALFYKSKLSDLAMSLIVSNDYASHTLSDTHRAWVKTKLMQATGRSSDEALLKGSNTKVGEWIDKIFSGEDDLIFMEAKNDWGTDIKPGKVKGGLAVVLEHRDLLTELPAPDGIKISDPEAVVKYLVTVFKVNKKMQKL
jgi:hypothetical protein